MGLPFAAELDPQSLELARTAVRAVVHEKGYPARAVVSMQVSNRSAGDQNPPA